MRELHWPWLEMAILIPLLGVLGLTLIRDRSHWKRVGFILCLLTFGCAAGEWIDFISLQSFEASDHWDVLAMIFQQDVFVVDELSAPLLPLVSLLYLVTIFSGQRIKNDRLIVIRLLLSESLLLATLSCKHPWVIIGLLSIGTILPAMEIHSRRASLRVYAVHMVTFVVLLISGQVMLDLGLSVVGCLFLTMAGLLRSGVAPVHCWLTDLFEKASFATALLFVTPMIGAYAIMRLVLPIAPDWILHGVAVVSLTTAVYTAGMALIQHEARRFFCFLFLSHSSLVLVGLEVMTPIGLTGALCVWISVGLSMAGFGLTLRAVEARTGRLSLDRYHGFQEQMPTLAAVFLITGLASIGFPGTLGFVGAELLVEGAVEVHYLIGGAVVVAAALNGIAILQAFFRIFNGARHVAPLSLAAQPPEKIALLILVVLLIGGGLYPQPGVASRYHASRELIRIHAEATGTTPEDH